MMAYVNMCAFGHGSCENDKPRKKKLEELLNFSAFYTEDKIDDPPESETELKKPEPGPEQEPE